MESRKTGDRDTERNRDAQSERETDKRTHREADTLRQTDRQRAIIQREGTREKGSE